MINISCLGRFSWKCCGMQCTYNSTWNLFTLSCSLVNIVLVLLTMFRFSIYWIELPLETAYRLQHHIPVFHKKCAATVLVFRFLALYVKYGEILLIVHIFYVFIPIQWNSAHLMYQEIDIAMCFETCVFLWLRHQKWGQVHIKLRETNTSKNKLIK